MAWSQLPDGEAITFRPGYSYAVVASVKASHSRADVVGLVAGKGLRIFDYAEEGERAGLGPDPRSPGYRAVALEATASKAGSVPWSVPWPASMVDGSSVLRAWQAPPGAPPLLPPRPPAAGKGTLVGVARVDLRPLGVLALVVAGERAWQWWRARRRRR